MHRYRFTSIWHLESPPEVVCRVLRDVEGSGTRAVFEEEVVARRGLLRSLALVARPFFRLNHAVMMRHGQRRLPVYLAGYQAGAERSPSAMPK